MNTCENCGNQFLGNFCPNCGKPVALERINGKYILKEIGSILSFDKGVLYTVRELILRPGKVVKEFLEEDRKRLVKPVIFLIFCSLIYTITQNLFQFDDRYFRVNDEAEDSILTEMSLWIQKNYGFANIFMSVFVAAWIKLFFKKKKFNIYEILILVFFVMGIQMLVYSIFGIIESITSLKILQIGSALCFIYFT